MGPVTVQLTRVVRKGQREKFEAALRDFLPRSLETPGQLGVQILRPPPDGDEREYGIIRRFESVEARDAFYASALFRDWNAIVEPLCEGQPEYEYLCGLETWFTLPGQRIIVPPPRWKMGVVTLIGVYPASMAVSMALHPLNGSWPFPLRALVNSTGIVVLLAWVIMPLLTRLLHGWLYPTR